MDGSGLKFKPQGGGVVYHGITTVCTLPVNQELHRAMMLIHDMLAAEPLLLGLHVLPPSSYLSAEPAWTQCAAAMRVC